MALRCAVEAPRAPHLMAPVPVNPVLEAAPPAPRAPRDKSVAASPDARGSQEFRVEFCVERVVVADSVRDALQQAVLAGATEVTAIVRQ